MQQYDIVILRIMYMLRWEVDCSTRSRVCQCQYQCPLPVADPSFAIGAWAGISSWRNPLLSTVYGIGRTARETLRRWYLWRKSKQTRRSYAAAKIPLDKTWLSCRPLRYLLRVYVLRHPNGLDALLLLTVGLRLLPLQNDTGYCRCSAAPAQKPRIDCVVFHRSDQQPRKIISKRRTTTFSHYYCTTRTLKSIRLSEGKRWKVSFTWQAHCCDMNYRWRWEWSHILVLQLSRSIMIVFFVRMCFTACQENRTCSAHRRCEYFLPTVVATA